MNEILRTKINWQLSNFCTGGCTYCPSNLWGGDKPESVDKFLSIVERIINHYTSLNRVIDWSFNGGEPLEFFDLPAVLKMCNEANGTTELFTNGGKLWLDWWAIGPRVDNLHLTYHYWQNPNLVKFIVQVFQKNQKQFDISVPLRPLHFDDDWNRATSIEQEFGISVNRTVLYKEASQNLGMLDYTSEQLERLFGPPPEEEPPPPQTFKERVEHQISISPSFTGKMCNIGLEKLNISHDGWVSGSDCNTLHLGNIWKDTFSLPAGPTRCIRDVCRSDSDQQITKFD